MSDLPLLRFGEDEQGNFLVTVRDTEVFDFIEDHLTEHELAYLWVIPSGPSPVEYAMAFSVSHADMVTRALAMIDQELLLEIYRRNNG